MKKHKALVTQTYTTRRNEKGEMVIDTTIKKTEKRHAYTVIRNVKYKGVEYKVGDNLEATGDDLSFLLRNNIIQ